LQPTIAQEGIQVLSDRQLWYVRREGAVSGPFPNLVVANHVLLGRFELTDEVSIDQLEWQPLMSVRALLPAELLGLQTENDPEKKQWLEERLKAAHRWADERTHQDRRQHEITSGPRGEERRKTSVNSELLALPHLHPALERWPSRRRYLAAFSILSVLALMVVLGLVFHQPVNPVKVGVVPELPQCQHAAAPQVNWNGCDKQEIRLRGADLSGSNLAYADFSRADLSGSRFRQALLVGANFNHANLNDADLDGADLSYSDLRGATLVSASFKGAVLDRAIWQDGRECAVGSRGQCR
ncbi:MAG: pentapeptide repeat-containing protein, partial [Sulfurimicrobium sp.]|nr:pentapeptide repeat-containing protein [Sulfurimicrobium sp.]